VRPRGFAGPNLLAMILFEKFGLLPTTETSRSKLEATDRKGPISAYRHWLTRLESHVLAAERLHGDDTKAPVLAKGKTVYGQVFGGRIVLKFVFSSSNTFSDFASETSSPPYFAFHS
jgi:transposase